MTSPESQPPQAFPQEKGKKLFEKMKQDLSGVPSIEGDPNGHVTVDGVELIPGKEMPADEVQSEDITNVEQLPEKEPTFKNGMSAQADWEKQKEAKEDEHYEQSNN